MCQISPVRGSVFASTKYLEGTINLGLMCITFLARDLSDHLGTGLSRFLKVESSYESFHKPKWHKVNKQSS